MTVVENPHVVDISSTRLRQLLPEGREYLPEAVYGYILRQRLYGTHEPHPQRQARGRNIWGLMSLMP